METKVNSTEEIKWYEGMSKYLNKIKVRLDILFLSFLGILAITVCHFCVVYDLEFALKQVVAVAMVLSPAFLVACLCIRESLVKCYRHYCCKECGHIHRLRLEELDKESNSLCHCTSCNKNTKHKMVSMTK